MKFIEKEFDIIRKKVKLNREVLYPNQQESNLSKVREWINDDQFFSDKIYQKGFLLAKYEKPTQLTNQKKDAKINHPIEKTVKRQLKSLQVEVLEYEQLKPLNELWNQYIQQLLKGENLQDNIYTKLLKADLHGAMIQVCYSKCKTYEGIEGIVVEESLKSFKLITPSNRSVIILKANSIFLLPVGNQTYKIYGFHLIQRPADRIKQKFKYHKANEFVLTHLTTL